MLKHRFSGSASSGNTVKLTRRFIECTVDVSSYGIVKRDDGAYAYYVPYGGNCCRNSRAECAAQIS